MTKLNIANYNPATARDISPSAITFSYVSPFETTQKQISSLKQLWGDRFAFVSMAPGDFSQTFGPITTAGCFTSDDFVHVVVKGREFSHSDISHEMHHAFLQAGKGLKRLYALGGVTGVGDLSWIDKVNNDLDHFLFLPEELQQHGTAPYWKRQYSDYVKLSAPSRELLETDLMSGWAMSRHLFGEDAFDYGIKTMVDEINLMDKAEDFYTKLTSANGYQDYLLVWLNLPIFELKSEQGQKIALRRINPLSKTFEISEVGLPL